MIIISINLQTLSYHTDTVIQTAMFYYKVTPTSFEYVL